MIDGFINVDIDRGDVQHDLRITPYPFTSGECAWINLSHVLEHFDKYDAYGVLKECYRILEVGGLITLAVPDLDKFITAHLTGDFSLLGDYRWTRLDSLMGGALEEPNEHERHRYMYGYETLAYMLMQSGFCKVHHRADDALIDNPQYAAISLYMEARKCSMTF